METTPRDYADIDYVPDHPNWRLIATFSLFAFLTGCLIGVAVSAIGH